MRDIEQATPTELDELANEAVSEALLEQTLSELAALSPIEYDLRRETSAETLGIRLSTLDVEVEKRRPKTKSSGNREGRVILLTDPDPWHDTVNLAFVLTSILSAI
jgi:hypothetical protein